MALTDENSNMVMPVSPYGGNGGFGGDWAWILLLLVLFGGWGNGGGFGGGELYPWLNNSQNINGGFRDQMLNTGINGIQNSITGGFGGVQNSLCSGFAGVNASIVGAQNGITQQMYSNQISDLERSFAAQTASSQGMTGLQSGLSDLRYTVATEACADRSAVNDALRDVIAANTASTQRILDTMCQDKIDAKNEKIAELQTQLQMAQLAATQNAQTAAIIANNEAQTSTLEQYLAPVPRPAYVVSNPNCCGNFGCAAA